MKFNDSEVNDKGQVLWSYDLNEDPANLLDDLHYDRIMEWFEDSENGGERLDDYDLTVVLTKR